MIKYKVGIIGLGVGEMQLKNSNKLKDGNYFNF